MLNNNKAKWTTLAITVLGIIAVIIASFVWVQADVKAVDTKVTVIKEEGCLPSRDNNDSIIKIEGRLEIIQVQQEAGFKEILERLPEK